MNKQVLSSACSFSQIAFVVPWEYTSYFSDALASAIGGLAFADMSFRPIWVDGEITEYGDVIGRDAEIKQELWFVAPKPTFVQSAR